MGTALSLLAIVAFGYGMFRPAVALPTALGTPSRWKVAGLYGALFVAGGLGADTAGESSEVDGPPPAARVAGTFEEEPGDAWPGGSAARDSHLTALVSLVSSGRYVEAQDEAVALAGEPYAAAWADTPRALADLAAEEARYERARRLPGRDLEGNRDAYAELALLYPRSERAGLYTGKRDDYAQRIVDRDNARLLAAQRARYRPAPRSSGCCKQCSKGKPCGNSCISRSYTCHKPPGCAC